MTGSTPQRVPTRCQAAELLSRRDALLASVLLEQGSGVGATSFDALSEGHALRLFFDDFKSATRAHKDAQSALLRRSAEPRAPRANAIHPSWVERHAEPMAAEIRDTVEAPLSTGGCAQGWLERWACAQFPHGPVHLSAAFQETCGYRPPTEPELEPDNTIRGGDLEARAPHLAFLGVVPQPELSSLLDRIGVRSLALAVAHESRRAIAAVVRGLAPPHRDLFLRALRSGTLPHHRLYQKRVQARLATFRDRPGALSLCVSDLAGLSLATAAGARFAMDVAFLAHRLPRDKGVGVLDDLHRTVRRPDETLAARQIVWPVIRDWAC